MPSPRILAAHRRDTAQRHRDHDGAIKINDVEGVGIYSSARWAEYLRNGGFLQEHDSKLLLQKSAWPAITSRKHLADAIIHLSLNGTWVKFTTGKVADLETAGEWEAELNAG